jgi:hypothetical protein
MTYGEHGPTDLESVLEEPLPLLRSRPQQPYQMGSERAHLGGAEGG